MLLMSELFLGGWFLFMFCPGLGVWNRVFCVFCMLFSHVLIMYNHWKLLVVAKE